MYKAAVTSVLTLAAIALVGCDDDQTYSTGDGDTDVAVDVGVDTATDPIEDTGGGDGHTVEQVCGRWNADRADLSEGSWSGSVAGCNAGDVAANGRNNTVKLVNLYRWMCGLNEDVSLDATKNSEAQACSLMMHANDDLDHSPPTSWTCYSGDGANGAGNSNIATTPAVQAMDMYMQDWGNDTTMGHRRWILSNALSSVGVGSTSEYSCLWILHYPFSGGNDWTAWPPPGPFPYEGVVMSWVGLDETGWTIQSDTINLSGASVTVTDAGANRPVTVNQLLGNYGSDHAISFIPNGWTSEVGHTYHVEVTGISPTISYDVQIVDCGG